MSQASGYRERNSTADRALTILQMFNDDKLVVPATEVAELLGVARSTAYRYLQTLVQAGFLSEDGRGGFRLGMKVLQLSRLARRSYGLATIAVPAMQELTERFRQTVLLTGRQGNAVVCLEREEAVEQYVRLSYERGTVLALNAGASAQVLLAWMDEPELDKLLATVELRRFTETSITDPKALKNRLSDIREKGYSITIGEVDAEAMGIAAPVFTSTGEVVAALSVVLIRSRVSPDAVDEIVTAVVETARQLTEQAALLES
jgi:DNA-binding IclR family transcriptional regulator